MVRISEEGYWIGEEAKNEHLYDEELGKALLQFFKKEQAKNLCDLGCGMGHYVRHFRESGISCDGFDGNPATPTLTQNTCQVLNLAEPHTFDTPYDWVLSLEVGEHIPKAYEKIYLENLHRNNRYGVVLSWGVKGQVGYGHVNCQNNDYIKEIFAKLGYTNEKEEELLLRQSATYWWYKHTLMVFRKQFLAAWI